MTRQKKYEVRKNEGSEQERLGVWRHPGTSGRSCRGTATWVASMLVLRSGIKEAVSNVAVPSIIGTKERGCERFERGGTWGGTASWLGMCRYRVRVSVH